MLSRAPFVFGSVINFLLLFKKKKKNHIGLYVNVPNSFFVLTRTNIFFLFQFWNLLKAKKTIRLFCPSVTFFFLITIIYLFIKIPSRRRTKWWVLGLEKVEWAYFTYIIINNKQIKKEIDRDDTVISCIAVIKTTTKIYCQI